MGTFEDPQSPAGSAQPQPGSPRYGPQAPAGPQGPAGQHGPAGPGAGYAGGPPLPPPPPQRRRRRAPLAITAAVALAVGAGSAWAATASGATATALTTSQIVSKTDPAVVDVVSTLGQNGTAAGTGIVLTSSGEVLTNNHVINGATSIKVSDVGNGQTYTGSVVGYDASHDIAVIQLQGASGLQTANLGNSSSVTVGSKVVAIGNAGGQGGAPSVASGTVTGLNQSITATDAASGTAEQLSGLIRTNAAIQAGDSGGPLTNASGQVIGIDTAASSGSVQLNSSTATQAFTIPINEAVSIARQIEAGASSATVHIGSTALLGVEIASASQQLGNPAAAGAQVAGVQPGSAAAGAGLTSGDVITAVGGHSVSSASDVRSALSRYHPGDKISITWTDQAGQSHSATAVLGSGPAG